MLMKSSSASSTGKIALFLQPLGLGDICFAQGVAHHFINQGYRVVWPVLSEFVEGLVRAYPRIGWCAHSLSTGCFDPEIHTQEPLIVPLRWTWAAPGSEERMWMRAKYDAFGLDYKTWKEHAHFERDLVREMRLCEEMGIDITKPYNLVNRIFRSSFDRAIDVNITNNYPIAEIVFRPEYSLFDYSTLIEHATEIHVVNSAIFYLLELLDYKGEAHLYARKPEEEGFPFTDYLQTKPYVLHY